MGVHLPLTGILLQLLDLLSLLLVALDVITAERIDLLDVSQGYICHVCTTLSIPPPRVCSHFDRGDSRSFTTGLHTVAP